MAIKINSKNIEKKHVYEDVIEDEVTGKKYPIRLTLKQLEEATQVTVEKGPLIGNAYLAELLNLTIDLDFGTLDTIASNAIKQFFGKTPR